MKNKFIISGLATAILCLLVGCNGGAVTSSEEAPSVEAPSEETPSEEAPVARDVIKTTLEGLRNGFAFDGDVNLKATYENTSLGETVSQRPVQYTYENAEKTAIQRKIYSIEEDGTKYLDDNEVLVEGEDGSAYYMELDYTNKVAEIQAVDSLDTPINYGLELGNPFAYIIESDFTKVNDTTYSLSKEKAAFFVSKLFGFLDDVFYTIPQEATFTFENETLKNIKIIPGTLDDQITIGYSTEPYTVSAVVDLDISDIGTARVDVPEVKEHKPEHDALGVALKKFGKNYTTKAKYTQVTTNLMNLQMSKFDYYYNMYFADDYLFYQAGYDKDATSYNKVNDVLLSYDDDGTFTAYGLNEVNNTWTQQAAASNGLSPYSNLYTYYLIPEIANVAPEIFEYNEKTGLYECCDELIGHIGAYCFIPPLENEEPYNGYGDKCTIKLEGDTITQIVISFYYNNSFNEMVGTFTFDYSDFGTTTLPSDIVVA